MQVELHSSNSFFKGQLYFLQLYKRKFLLNPHFINEDNEILGVEVTSFCAHS